MYLQELVIVFLITVIQIFIVFITSIISVISDICNCTLVGLERIGGGRTTTTDAEHRSNKLVFHAATFPTSACLL
jgi:hypothetical protein